MNILIYPNEILRKKCTPVEEITNELVLTAHEMMKLMKASGGIGLASIQVGILQRFLVMDTTEIDAANGFKGILFNPRITAKGQKYMPYIEGCLSFPKVKQPTCRKDNIRVEYIDEYKKMQNIVLQGISAICFQHELEHLDGILLIDHKQTGARK